MGAFKEAISNVATFSFTRNPPPTTCVIDIAGLQGRGKTHLALSAPAPAICDTEDKAWDVLNKGIGDSEKHFTPYSWDDVLNFTKHCETAADIQSVIYDTVSDVEEYAYQHTLADLGKKSLYSPQGGPVMYRYVNEKIRNDIILRLKRVDKNVIFISRMKDEYVDNNRTGIKIRDGWRKMPYAADYTIEALDTLPSTPKSDVIPGTLIWKVTKNGKMRPGTYRPYLVLDPDDPWTDLMAQLKEECSDPVTYIDDLRAKVTGGQE